MESPYDFDAVHWTILKMFLRDNRRFPRMMMKRSVPTRDISNEERDHFVGSSESEYVLAFAVRSLKIRR